MTATSPSRVSTIGVIAHRGASEDVPEHTLAAYRKAIEDGADALECDIRMTRDGHLVCVHDRRVDRTSNGRGLVSTHELADLASLDWGSWRESVADFGEVSPDAADFDAERRSILTLERLLEVVGDAGRRVELAIEAKHPTRYGALVERRLVELLGRFGWDRVRPGGDVPVRFMSFSSRAVRRMQIMAPEIPTVLLFERIPLRFRDGTPPLGVPIVGPSIDALQANPGYVEASHRRGAQVHVWTVDHTSDVLFATELGVDAIITNRPRKVLNLLGR